MSKAIAQSFFIDHLLRATNYRPRLVVVNREQVIEACREYSLLRKFDVVKELALSIDGEIGRYYLNIPLQSPDVIETSKIEDRYLPRVLLSIAQATIRAGDVSEAQGLLNEVRNVALKNGDYYSAFEAAKQKAIMLSDQGGRAFALKQMEGLKPLVNLANKQHGMALDNYRNSLAIMLSEEGRVDEAHSIIQRAIVSPYGRNWPGIHQTAAEIAALRRPALRSHFVMPGVVQEPAQEQTTVVPYEQFMIRKEASKGSAYMGKAPRGSDDEAQSTHLDLCIEIEASIRKGRNNLSFGPLFRRIKKMLHKESALAPEATLVTTKEEPE